MSLHLSIPIIAFCFVLGHTQGLFLAMLRGPYTMFYIELGLVAKQKYLTSVLSLMSQKDGHLRKFLEKSDEKMQQYL